MSDYSPPRLLLPQGGYQDSNLGISEHEIAARIKLLQQINPYMGSRPDVLEAMATSPLSTGDLIDSGAQHYAMLSADNLAKQLQQLSPAAGRALYGQLTPAQQATVQKMGYQPQDNQDFDVPWYGEVIKGVSAPLSFVGKGLSAIPGVSEAGGAIFDGLTWAGDQAFHVYRATRLQDDFGQAAGWIGAIAGGVAAVSAIGLAPFTGGASLVALGAVGLGATLGMGAASAAVSGMDWIRAYGDSWDGEETFDRPSMEKVQSMLADPRASGLAQDLATSGINLTELAKEMAGEREVSLNSQLGKIEELAAKMAAPGTAANDKAKQAIFRAVQDPTFQEAVQTLIDGKISLGRDLADVIGLDPSSGLGMWVSGGTDMLFTLALDPTLQASKMVKAGKAAVYGARAADSAEGVVAIKKILYAPGRLGKENGVYRQWKYVADAIAKSETTGSQLIRTVGGGFETHWDDFLQHKKMLMTTINPDTGRHFLERANDFNVDHLIDYMLNWKLTEPLLRGVGTVPNSTRIVLKDMSRLREATLQVRRRVRDLTQGAASTKTMKLLTEEQRKWGEPGGLLEQLGAPIKRVFDDSGVVDTPWRLNTIHPGWYEAGQAAGNMLRGHFVGTLSRQVTKMSTMAMAGKHFDLGDAKQVRAFVHMFDLNGIPSFAREAIITAINTADSDAAKLLTAHGALASVTRVIGDDLSPAGKELIERYLEHQRQIYGSGRRMLINGHEASFGTKVSDTAEEIAVPNWKELFKASNESFMARHMYGVADLPILEASVNRFWKPLVLLRLGFIPRAAGEEAAAYLTRGGIGSHLQEKASLWMGKQHAYERLHQLEQAGKDLPAASQLLLAGGREALMPKHIKPVFRMAAALNHEDPALVKIEQYMKSLALRAEHGVFVTRAKQERAIERAVEARRAATEAGAPQAVLDELDQAIGKGYLDPIDRFNDWVARRTGGLKVGQATKWDDTMFIPAPDAHLPPQLRRLARLSTLDAIAFGNPYSLRRMLFGGVDDAMIRGASRWAEGAITPVMRELSAIESGPITLDREDRLYRHEWVTKTKRNGKSKRVREKQIYLSGERQWYAIGSKEGKYGLFDKVQRTMWDPINRRVMDSHISRIKGGAQFDEAALDEHFTRFLTGGEKSAFPSVADPTRLLLNELIQPGNRHHWEAMLEDLRRTPHTNEFGELLQSFFPLQGRPLPESVPEMVELLDSAAGDVADRIKVLTKSKNIDQETKVASMKKLRTLQTQVKDVTNEIAHRGSGPLDWLHGMDRHSQGYVSQLLRRELVARGKGPWSQWRSEGTDDLFDGFLRNIDEFDRLHGAPSVFVRNPDWEVGDNPVDEFVSGFGSSRGSWSGEDFPAVIERVRSLPNKTPQEERLLAQIDNHEAQFGRFDEPDGFETLGPMSEEDEFTLGWGHPTAIQARDANMLYRSLGDAVQKRMDAKRSGRGAFFYENLTDARQAAVDEIMNLIADPNMQSEGTAKLIAGLQLDDEGQYVDGALKNATVMLYEAPIQFSTDAAFMQPANVMLRHTANPTALSMERADGKRYLDIVLADDVGSANAEVAAQLGYLIPTRPNLVSADMPLAGYPDEFKAELERTLLKLEEQGYASRTFQAEDLAAFNKQLRTVEAGHDADLAEDALEDWIVRYGNDVGRPPTDEMIAAQRDILRIDEKQKILAGHMSRPVSDPMYRASGPNERMVFDLTPLLEQAKQARANRFDWLVRHSSSPEILYKNRALIERALIDEKQNTILVSNLGLAEELQRTQHALNGGAANLAPRTRVAYQPREVTDGRIHDLLIPDVASKVNGETKMWYYPPKYAEKILRPLPEAGVEQLRRLSNDIYDDLIDSIGRGEKMPATRPRMRLIDGPEGPVKESIMYRYAPDHSGRQIFLTEDDLVTPDMAGTVFLRDSNEKLDIGDTHYFDIAGDLAKTSPTDEILWEIAGPVMSDIHETAHGVRRTRRSDEVITLPGRRKKAVQAFDRVPIRRSNVEDVDLVPATDKQSFVAGEIGKWDSLPTFDKWVQIGFERGIGPAIDALIRKPMAYHAYITRYIANERAMDWMLQPDLVERVKVLMATRNGMAEGTKLDVMHKELQRLAAYHYGNPAAGAFTRSQTFGWMRGFDNPADRSELISSVIRRAQQDDTIMAKQALKSALSLRKKVNTPEFNAALTATDSVRDFAAMIKSQLPDGILSSKGRFEKWMMKEGDKPEIAHWLYNSGAVDDLVALETNLEHVSRAASEAASIAAINDVIPFVDSHEFKTQWADHAKGFMPFWYAEENFMKRWARGIAQEGPALIRRAQLTYMGFKNAGIIRTDQSGKDWFVYPGSGLLAGAIDRMVPGLDQIGDVGVMFQTPTDQMLPGLSSKFGTPSFNPLVSLPLEITRAWMPELQPLERALLGDYASQRAIVQQIIPAHFRNLFDALGMDESSTSRYASAQLAAIAHLEAAGRGLPEEANAGQLQEFMDRVKDHARIIIVAQALAGFAAPGAPSTIEGGHDAPWSGLGIDDPQNILADGYSKLVRLYGVEDGTAKFLELYPDASLDDIAKDGPERYTADMGDIKHPLVYSTPMNQSVSGAPIPSTESALAFAIENEGYFAEFPNAAPWLLPQDFGSDSRSQYAYDQQTIAGLRRRRTPEEFLRAIRFKEAAGPYFEAKNGYNTKIAQAEEAGDASLAHHIRAERDRELLLFQLAHPIFREELQGNDGQERRRKVLEEMQTVIRDPQAPASPQLLLLSQAMDAFNGYRTQLAAYAGNRSAAAESEVDMLKQRFATYMSNLVDANPSLRSFWTTIIRPEASL